MKSTGGGIWSAAKRDQVRHGGDSGSSGFSLGRWRRHGVRAVSPIVVATLVGLWAMVIPFDSYAHMVCTTSTGLSCSGGTIAISTVPIANGGTGQTGALAGFDALSPMTAVGDILHGGALGTGTVLAVGAANLPLKVNSGGTDVEYGVLAIAGGGTGQTAKAAAFDALSPMTAEGDIVLMGGSEAERLAIGGSATVLTSNGTTASWAAAASGVSHESVQTTLMNLNADSIFFSPSSGMLCAAETDCKTQTQTAFTFDNMSARANKDIGGTNHTIEIAQGSCTSAITLDCGAGDACVTVASTSSDAPTAADTDAVTVSAGNCYVGKITATGDTNADVIHMVSWDQTG